MLTFDELVDKVREVAPYAAFEEDNYGQIIIYTDLMWDENTDGVLIPFVEDLEDD